MIFDRFCLPHFLRGSGVCLYNYIPEGRLTTCVRCIQLQFNEDVKLEECGEARYQFINLPTHFL